MFGRVLSSIRFRDRVDAGRRLAERLKPQYYNRPDAVVLGLPRGGVVLAYEVARTLRLPLDIVVPRKIGCPGHEEFAVGALTEDGDIFLNHGTLRMLGLTADDLKKTIEEEQKEAARRLKVYRGNMPPRNFENKTVIIVDDGIATGSTMLASIKAAKSRKAKEVVVAVPVMPADNVSKFEKECDNLVALAKTHDFHAVGQYYDVFDQTDDATVIDLMQKANKEYVAEQQQQQS